MIVIITKLSDFGTLYIYPGIYTFYCYAFSDFGNPRYILSFIDYRLILGLAVFGVIVYAILLVYHKQDFENGSLGLDENQRTLWFGNIKFYTTLMLFLMGNSFANFFLMAFLNSFICDDSIDKLFNFPNANCYDE